MNAIKKLIQAAVLMIAADKPSIRDQLDAIEFLEEEDGNHDNELDLDDFELSFLGTLSVEDLSEYDDLSGWLDFKPDEFKLLSQEEKLEELQSFRGKDWAERAEIWLTQGIPPIIVIQDEFDTRIGDGRGRVNFASLFDLKLPVWKMTYRERS